MKRSIGDLTVLLLTYKLREKEKEKERNHR